MEILEYKIDLRKAAIFLVAFFILVALGISNKRKANKIAEKEIANTELKKQVNKYYTDNTFLTSKLAHIDSEIEKYTDTIIMLKRAKNEAKKRVIYKYKKDTVYTTNTDRFIYDLVNDNCDEDVADYVKYLELENIGLDTVVGILEDKNDNLIKSYDICGNTLESLREENFKLNNELKKKKKWNDIWKYAAAGVLVVVIFS